MSLQYADDTSLTCICSGPSNYDVATEMNHHLEMGKQDEAKS